MIPTMSDYETIEKAIRFIQRQQIQQPSLDEIAGSVGLSPAHFQRLFSRWAGISPKRFLQVLTLEDAVSKMSRNKVSSMLELSNDLGLSSSSRLHEHFIQLTAMTPGEYKKEGASIEIYYGEGLSQFGSVYIAWTERGVCKISFANDDEGFNYFVECLKGEWPLAMYKQDNSMAKSKINHVFSANKKIDKPLSLLVKGTNFQINVWRALLNIPVGCIATYQQISHLIEKPTAARAVGTAIGANPLAFIIPCHRVIRQSGGLGGYRWGLARKQSMLAYEFSQKD